MANVARAAWEHAANAPDRTALRGSGRTLTYGALRERSAAYAGALRAAGIQPGDRVLLTAPSVPEFAVAHHGAHALGAVLVTVNTMAPAPEIEYVLRDAECSLAIAWHESGVATANAAEAYGIPCWTLEPEAPAAGGEPLEELHEAGDETVATILYTSGTTGRPKGAMLTRGNTAACADVFREVLELTAEDRFGTALPLFHVFGQCVVMGTALSAGASLAVLSPFEPEAMIAMLREERLTAMAGVPTMWNAMLHASPETTKEAFASLRLAASGGAALPEEVMRAFTERFGCVILEGYGLSETTGAATFNGLHRERKAGAVGIALPGCEIECRDEQGASVPTGEVGEVFVRGPVIMAGYWNREDATAEALHDGWLKTGDLGTIDGEGDLRIVDRLKDLIIRGGYNVYPREVEEVLYEHPDIVEVAVVGVPDPHFGEEVAAVLALRPGADHDAAALRGWAKERLSAYKVPRLFQVVDALPKGATGKVLKRAIDRDAIRAGALAASSS